mmetsp:Transcript_4756/g.12215  ORF Transcript_4756/g.12215 Transcript_4756/m.12215 type:complete len:234 (-) Transcript_4756:484-1185(-)
MGGRREFVVNLQSLGLGKLSVDRQHAQSRPQSAKQIPRVTNLTARSKEDDGFAFQVGFDEGKEAVELVLGGDQNIRLLESIGRRRGVVVVDADVFDRFPIDAQGRQVLDVLRLRGTEQQGLPCLSIGQVIQNSDQLVPKPHVQNPVGLVQDQHLKRVDIEVRSLFQMLQQPTRGADEDIGGGNRPLFSDKVVRVDVLLVLVLSSHQQSQGKGVVLPDFPQDGEYLARQFPGRR